MKTRKTRLGADHPDTLTSMNNLAFTWKGLGRDAEAVQLMEDCVQRVTQILGAKHPASLSSHLALDVSKAEHLGNSGENPSKEVVT